MARTTVPPLATVHPRGCGDRALNAYCQPCGGGSSPRVRGSDQFQRFVTQTGRFIPAGAGIGHSRYGQRHKETVHPRGCGDRLRCLAFTFGSCGSSPRVRGSETQRTFDIGHARFIPAGAGIGKLRVIGLSATPVHPRGCGDRRSLRSAKKQASGSSPRVRGSAPNDAAPRKYCRFIPAGAGIGGTQIYGGR